MDEETANIILLSEGAIDPKEKICDIISCVYMFIIFVLIVIIVGGLIYVSEDPVNV
jgi:hypothetical protein